MTKKRSALLEALKFFAQTLGLEAYPNLEIRVSFKHDFAKVFGAYAQVDKVNKDLLIIEFDAKINEISLFTMAHECIHCRQYASGVLSEDAEGFQLWQGKHVEDNLKYYEEPWEVEAMAGENLLTYQYIYFRDNK